MSLYLDLIRIGDARTKFLKAVLADGTPISDVRYAMILGFPLSIEMYRSEMTYGDVQHYSSVVEEAVRALSALESGEEFVYSGITIPAE